MLDLAYTGLRIGDVAILDRQHLKQRTILIDGAGASDRHLDRQREDRYACRAAAVADAGPTGNLAFIVTRRGTPPTKGAPGTEFVGAAKACRGSREIGPRHAQGGRNPGRREWGNRT